MKWGSSHTALILAAIVPLALYIGVTEGFSLRGFERAWRNVSRP